MSKYYLGIEKVKRSDFYTDFVANENSFKEDDLYEIDMVYFISRFFVPDLPRNYIPKFYFDLVESAVAIRSESAMSPRILNWRSSDNLIFNEYLKTVMFKRYSNEKNDSRFVHDLLYIPNGSKTCEQSPNEPIKVKDELSRDVAFEMDVCGGIGGAKSNDNLSPLKQLSFFTESQMIALEPTFRKLETPKFKFQILSPIIFDKSPLIMHQHCGSTHKKFIIYFNKKHPFEDYVGFEVPDILVDQFTDWCYAKKVCESDCGMYACAFAEFISHELFDISTNMFNATNHCMRYGALLLDYARKKKNDGAISERVVTGNVTSRLGGAKILRDVVSPVVTTKIRNR
ncbi:hypothetical protein FXO38_22056 [Capsicum annuum]|nr:hypothetical protein FXO38_22056 [Capsicum annuum]